MIQQKFVYFCFDLKQNGVLVFDNSVRLWLRHSGGGRRLGDGKLAGHASDEGEEEV